MRVQGVVLKHHGDVAIARGHIVHDSIAYSQRAARYLFQTGDHAHCRRLSASRRPNQDHEFAVRDFKVEFVDGLVTIGIDLGQFLKRDGTHQLFLSWKPLLVGSTRACR